MPQISPSLKVVIFQDSEKKQSSKFKNGSGTLTPL